jgi:hypothetical protein
MISTISRIIMDSMTHADADTITGTTAAAIATAGVTAIMTVVVILRCMGAAGDSIRRWNAFLFER